MLCREWESKGLLYLYNELESEKVCNEYRKHLENCRICQKNIEELQEFKKRTETIKELVRPSERCIENIIQKAYEEISPRSFELYHPMPSRQEWSLHTVLNRIYIRLIPVAVAGIIFVLVIAKIISYRTTEPLLTIPDNRVEMLLSILEQKIEIFDAENDTIYLELKNIEYRLVEIGDEIERLEEL